MKPAGPGDHPPVPATYWVVAGKLLAGPFPGAPDPVKAAAKVSRLLEVGVTTFVNLMEADETDVSGRPFTPYTAALGDNATMTRHPIHDLSIPTRQGMTATLDTIDAALSNGGVYVHCWGGVGRTGTVVGCWLLRHGLATPDNVIERIRLLRRADPVRGHRPSPETPQQRRFILKWPEQ